MDTCLLKVTQATQDFALQCFDNSCPVSTSEQISHFFPPGKLRPTPIPESVRAALLKKNEEASQHMPSVVWNMKLIGRLTLLSTVTRHRSISSTNRRLLKFWADFKCGSIHVNSCCFVNQTAHCVVTCPLFCFYILAGGLESTAPYIGFINEVCCHTPALAHKLGQVGTHIHTNKTMYMFHPLASKQAQTQTHKTHTHTCAHKNLNSHSLESICIWKLTLVDKCINTCWFRHVIMSTMILWNLDLYQIKLI